LDAGVSGEARSPGENLFLTTFRFGCESYVGMGVDDLSKVAAAHPGKRFVTYDGNDFPFADEEFDWVFSNAVIEHVGGPQEQVHFLNEMLRVGRYVFFTTPNKFFPIESHTNSLFRHWLPGDHFYDWCAKHSPYWTKQTLQLLSKADLKRVIEGSKARDHEIFCNRMFGWPMTFTVVCSRRVLPSTYRGGPARRE